MNQLVDEAFFMTAPSRRFTAPFAEASLATVLPIFKLCIQLMLHK